MKKIQERPVLYSLAHFFSENIEGLAPGSYRFAVCYNASLLYEDRFTIQDK